MCSTLFSIKTLRRISYCSLTKHKYITACLIPTARLVLQLNCDDIVQDMFARVAEVGIKPSVDLSVPPIVIV